MIGTVLDIVIAFLLLATVIYCIKLSRKITLIHQGKEELNDFIHDFNNAIVRAEENISELKNIGSETEEKLQEHVQKARFLANDLSFLMDKGEKISSSLEHNLTMSKVVAKSFNSNQSRLMQENKTSKNIKPQFSNVRKNIENTEEVNDRDKKRKEIEKLLNMNEISKSNKNIQNPNLDTNIGSNIEQSQMAVQPEANGQLISPMTHGKRKALDEVLEQIASRKNEVSSGGQQVVNSSSQINLTETAVNQVTKPSATSKGGVVFDKRRLSEVLKTAQESK